MSLVNGRCRALDLTRVSFVSRLISGQVHLFRILKRGTHRLYVFWDIDQDGAWPTRGCDVKRLFYRLWNLARFVNQVTVLRDRECDSRYVGLLKSVVADEIGGHLTRKRDDGHAIHVGGRDSCHEVRCSGTGGGHAHTYFPGCSRVAIRRVRGCLFVAHEVVRNGILVKEFVVDGYDDASRDAENRIHVFVFETFHKCLGTAQVHWISPIIST